MDLSMEELQSKGLTPVLESPASTKAPVVRRESRGGGGGDAEVVKCSGNAPIQSNLLKMRTKSRLSDPPTPNPNPQVLEMMKSGRVAPKSGQLKSGFFGKTPKGGGGEEEEDGPFVEEDLPEEYRKDKLSLWIVLEWLSLVLIIAGFVCTLAIPYLRKKKVWELELWKWESMVLVLICGRLVSSWIVKIVVFFVERNFLLRKRVLYFVYGIRKRCKIVCG